MHVEFRMCHDVAELVSPIEGDDRSFHSDEESMAWTGHGIQAFRVAAASERVGVVGPH